MPKHLATTKRATSLLDYFIHLRLREDGEDFLHARNLVASLLIFISVLGSSAIILSVSGISSLSRLISVSICFFVTAAVAILLVYFRHSGNYVTCSALAIFIISLAVVSGIYVSGGARQSPATPLLILPPLMAYFLRGVRWGNYVFAGAIFLLLFFVTLSSFGFAFPQPVESPTEIESAKILITLIGLFAIGGVVQAYEFTATTLKRERDSERHKIIALAQIDSLTGLSNRRHSDMTLTHRIETFSQLNSPLFCTLGYLDLNGFKQINDQYGHDIGDEVLCVVSDRMRDTLRSSDFVGRYGGDEFTLVFDWECQEPCLESMAQRLLNAISQPIATSAGCVNVGASLGFARFPQDADNIDMLKKAADAAMYEAKDKEKGWCFYRTISQ